jgi:hypothetical protein
LYKIPDEFIIFVGKESSGGRKSIKVIVVPYLTKQPNDLFFETDKKLFFQNALCKKQI